MPHLSAIIPFERGHHLLVAALDGFLALTGRRAATEVVVVAAARPRLPARLRRLAIRHVQWPRGRRIAGAIAAGASAAQAPVVAVLDARWRPMPGLVRYCLDFHARQGDADVLSLGTCLDPTLARDPLLWWMHEQHLAGLSSLTPGIHSWRAVRFDAFSARRDWLRAHPIPDGHGDEWLMRSAWVRQAPLRVFVEPAPVLVTSAAPSLGDVLAAEYLAASARLAAMRASSQTFAGEAVDDRFQHPERYLLSRGDQRELAAAIAAMQHALADHSPRFAVGAVAEQFATLGKLYLAAVSHARSAGWSDAKAGGPRRVTRAWPGVSA